MKNELYALCALLVLGSALSNPAELRGEQYSIGDWTGYGLPTTNYAPGSFKAVMGGGDVTMTMASQVAFGSSTNNGGTLWFRPATGVGDYGSITVSFDKLITGFSLDVGVLDPDGDNPGMPNEIFAIKSVNGISYTDWVAAGHSVVATVAKNTSSSFTKGTFDSSSGEVYATTSSGGLGLNFQTEAISSVVFDFKAVGAKWGAGFMMDNVGFSTTPIPEPSAMGLLGGAALLGVILVGKRRKK